MIVPHPLWANCCWWWWYHSLFCFCFGFPKLKLDACEFNWISTTLSAVKVCEAHLFFAPSSANFGQLLVVIQISFFPGQNLFHLVQSTGCLQSQNKLHTFYETPCILLVSLSYWTLQQNWKEIKEKQHCKQVPSWCQNHTLCKNFPAQTCSNMIELELKREIYVGHQWFWIYQKGL